MEPLSTITQTRYDLHDRKVQQITIEDEKHIKRDRRKIDLQEEYYRLGSGKSFGAAEDEWEPVRVPRPEGTPEWGVPPPGPSQASSSPRQ